MASYRENQSIQRLKPETFLSRYLLTKAVDSNLKDRFVKVNIDIDTVTGATTSGEVASHGYNIQPPPPT